MRAHEGGDLTARIIHRGCDARRHVVDHVARNGAEQVIELPSSPCIVPLVVTLDRINLAGFGTRALVEAGWLPGEVGPLPVLSLWDFRAVLEVLVRPAEVIHYFTRRAEFERDVRYQGYEMDLLGYYLQHGLGVGQIEDAAGSAYDPAMPVVLLGYARLVSRFLVAPSLANPVGNVERPVARRGGWIDAVIALLEARRPRGWLRIAKQLLDVPADGQVALERAVRASRAVRSGRAVTHPGGERAPAPRFPVAVHGPSWRPEVVTVIDVSDGTPAERDAAFPRAMQAVADRYPAAPVVAIGLASERGPCDEAYERIALIEPASGRRDGETA